MHFCNEIISRFGDPKRIVGSIYDLPGIAHSRRRSVHDEYLTIPGLGELGGRSEDLLLGRSQRTDGRSPDGAIHGGLRYAGEGFPALCIPGFNGLVRREISSRRTHF